MNKKGKYVDTNPKLKSLLATDEYRRTLALLLKLKKEGILASFLETAGKYWDGLDIFRLAKEEKEGTGRGVANTIRKDWEGVWPKALDKESKEAFASFAGFWKRLEQSRLFDDVMKTVLPDFMEGTKAGASADAESLANMDEEERQSELLFRLESSRLVQEYVKLSEGDEAVQAVAPDVVPFIGALVSGLERKAAMQTESLGIFADAGVLLAIVASTLLVLSFVGIVKLPFGDESPLPAASKPTVVFDSGDATPPLPASAPALASPAGDGNSPPPASPPTAESPSE